MAKTVPADFLDKESIGYVILAFPSENFKSYITRLLNDLAAELPDVIWPMPPEQLHITLCEIIQPKPYSQDKEVLYKLHKEQYETVPAQTLSAFPKFTITFDTIEVSPQAIIVKSSNSDSLNSIREKLVSKIELPKETRTPPDISHSSIARYLKEVDLEIVQKVVARHKIDIKEEIVEFKLLRNEVLPLQKYEVIRTFPLAVSRQ
jgi:2'-5' RNA ligase